MKKPVFSPEEGAARVGFFQALQPRIHLCGNAIATYYSRGAYGPESLGPTSYFKETDILEKQDGQWKIVHIHVSATPS